MDKLLFHEESMVLRCFSRFFQYFALFLLGPYFIRGSTQRMGSRFSFGPWIQTRQAHSFRPVRHCLMFLSFSVSQSRTESHASLVSHVLGSMQKGWRSYIEEFRSFKEVEGFCCKFIYGDCRVQGQRFCTRSETSLYYSELLYGKVSPQVFFTMKLVCFIGFLRSSYLVLFIFPLHDIDVCLF